MRASNIIQQKCNWLMVVGARLDQEQVGHDLEHFAPLAQKTIVDIDDAELAKYPDTWCKFLLDLNHPYDARYGGRSLPFVSGDDEWLAECKAIYTSLRYELEGQDGGDFVDPYRFIRELSDAAQPGDILVPGSSGMQSCAFYQAFKVKHGQRILCCNTIGAMGLEPMAIGASVASGKRVIVITGDGGFAQNVQELEVVRRYNLPIHYFVFDNGGYGSIAAMQDTRFGQRVGSTPESGFTLPSLSRIAEAWRLPYFNFGCNGEMADMRAILSLPCPTITGVCSSLDFRYACKVNSSMVDGRLIPDPMQDMSPKLPAGELERLMK